jgi:predicted metalloendopeptidase
MQTLISFFVYKANLFYAVIVEGSKKDWWDPSTLSSFVNRTKCMRDQYDAFKVNGEARLKVNGKLTLGENIADNGGMKIDYLGYGK